MAKPALTGMQKGAVFVARKKVNKQNSQSFGAEITPRRGPVEFFRSTFVGQMLLCLATVVMLMLSFPPFDIWPLAYVALIPFVLVAGAAGIGTRRILIVSLLAGLIFWLVSLYWLSWVTPVGYFASVLYLSFYFPATAMLVRAATRRRWPTMACLPIFWVALEYARSWIISGFPWFYLAHTQYSVTPLIQISDITGQYGVSFFVVAANGAVIDILRMLPPLRAKVRGAIVSATLRVVVMAAMTAGLLIYGQYRINQYSAVTTPGPKMGIVQRAIPISLGGRVYNSDEVFDMHREYSYPLLSAGCDLIVWPETMLPVAGLNSEFLQTDFNNVSPEALKQFADRMISPDERAEYSGPDQWKLYLNVMLRGGMLLDGQTYPGSDAYAMEIEKLSRLAGCPVLAGATTIKYNPNPIDAEDWWQYQNGALIFSKSWKSEPDFYSKIHLVPFSEYVPFRKSAPWFYKILRSFVPAAMMQLVPGESIKRPEIGRNGKKYRIATPICFEGTFDRECRKMSYEGGKKAVDLLVNLSNDGWFYWQAMKHASTENIQHLSHYCFRAVENRVPVVRSVNTGISASIDSCGRIVAAVGQSVSSPGGRKVAPMAEGCLILGGTSASRGPTPIYHGPEILIDTRESIYGQIADIFAQVVLLIAVMATGTLTFCQWREKAVRK